MIRYSRKCPHRDAATQMCERHRGDTSCSSKTDVATGDGETRSNARKMPERQRGTNLQIAQHRGFARDLAETPHRKTGPNVQLVRDGKR